MNTRNIVELGEKILSGHRVTYEEAISLTNVSDIDIPLLAAYANKVREAYAGNGVDMCGIVNARSGLCSEDCKFCAQSAHYATQAAIYPLLKTEDIVEAAKKAEACGAKRVSIVTSGKGMENDTDFAQIIVMVKSVIAATDLKVCANLGTVDSDQARELARAGVKRYAHNLETSARYYPEICTTHPFIERVNTLKAAKEAGLELCSGGIIGLGESWQDRIDLAFALRELEVASIPINILNPLKGTPMENARPPRPLDTIKTFAIFRFILPDKVLRPAGGREINLRDMQGMIMLSGANGLIVGNYLTFTGRDTAMDFTLVKDAGLQPA
jgi:biotin synthase